MFAWIKSFIAKEVTGGIAAVGFSVFYLSYNLTIVEVLGLTLLMPMISITGLYQAAVALVAGPVLGK